MSGPAVFEEPAEAIFARAAARGRALGLSYAGALTPREAHRVHEAGTAALVDVRTLPEWQYVGHVPNSLLIEWRRFRETQSNPAFLADLCATFDTDDTILLLCRSGVRSHHAAEAASRVGFRRVYNILEGFEGDLDSERRRGLLGGWRNAGLPWTQS